MSKLIEIIAFAVIEATVKTQARAALNEEALADYIVAAKEAKGKGADSPFPALVVFRDKDGTNWLADGFTRRKALKAAGFTETKCEIKEGTARDAWLFACTANVTHGARLTNEDKQHNLAMAMKDPELKIMSSNALAKILGVSGPFVNKNRPADSGERTAVRGGKAAGKVDTKNIGKKTGKKATKKTAKKATKTPAASSKNATGTFDGENTDEESKESGPKTPTLEDFDPATQSAIKKISSTRGGEDGEKIKAALIDGTLNLSKQEIQTFGGTSPARIKQIYLLVTEQQLKPSAAVRLIDSPVDGKTKVSDLILGCIANDGKLEEKIEGENYRILVWKVGRVKVESSIIPKG